MAEEVPVSDVLCNATEYLCKLGSNLRSRSENLREKRMSKDNLRNAHAVRKAATKLLLMCDLSKKSLENVEISVRKVLGILDSSRCSQGVGAKIKTDSSKPGDAKKECFYIEYDSCKLRISKKILLDHFTSVKVLAKCMPASMTDKYPVYYKCSLYEKRKKSRFLRRKRDEQSQNKESTEDESSKTVNDITDKDLSHDSDVQEPSCVETVEASNENQDRAESASSEYSSKRPKKKKDKENKEALKPEKQSKPCSEEKEICPNSETSKQSEHKSESDQNCNDDQNDSNNQELASQLEKPNLPMEEDKEVLKEKSRERKLRTSSDSSDQPQNVKTKEISKTKSKTNDKLVEKKNSQEKVEEMDKSEKSRKKSKSRVRFLDDSSDSSSSPSKSVESNKRKKIKLNEEKAHKLAEPEVVSLLDDDSSLDSPKKPMQSPKGGEKTKKSQDSDSETEKKSPKGGEKSEQSEDSDSKIEKMSPECGDKTKDSDSKTEKESSEHGEKTKDNDDSDSKTEKRPLLKLVSLNKLLKPDVLKKELYKTDEKKLSTKPVKKTYENRKQNREKEYLMEKKKEVLAFKPKKFHIVVTRLPSFTDDYLCKYGLKKIIQHGSVIYKLTDLDEKTNQRSSKKSRKKSMENENTVDSENTDDADKNKTRFDEGVAKTKHALLNSDSDSSECNKNPDISSVETPKKKSSEKSDSENTKEKNAQTKRNQQSSKKSRKKSMENENTVDSENTDDADKNKTRFDEGVAKTKHALLNSDSDSSECNKNPDISSVETPKKKSSEKSDSENTKEKNAQTKTNQQSSKNARMKSMENENTVDNENTDDADKNKTRFDEGVAKSKHALLNSDSDSSESNKNPDISSAETPKKKSSEKSDSENTKEKKAQTTSLEIEDENSEKSDVHKDDLDSRKDELEKNKTVQNENSEELTNKSPEPADPPKTPECKDGKSNQTTPRSKRKLIMESMHAKKMLLTYSSSSDTEDEQLKSALKDIKNSLLNGSSSDEDINIKKSLKKNPRQLATPSDSDDSLKLFKRKKKSKKDILAEKEQDVEVSSISQVDGTNDEKSNSSSSQMGRSKTKVSSSSNQSSENVDSNDIEINRLSDLSSLNRPSRRRSSRESRSGRRMPKPPPVPEEVLPPVSSASEAESDAGDAEELPPIPMQELNGDGINHLAKEDLLAQSDSSSSHNDKANGSEEDKKDDSEEEDNVKSRRRKPNAISSDSEAGSTRRKDKISDFEDSDEDSEPAARNKNKRKKKSSDSDGSQSSNDGSKKKRRRIKQVKDSDGSGSDTENEGKNKHGRKNIRKVMSKDQLEEATKKAARREKERVARIAERQKTYNNVDVDETGKPDEVVLDKVVLDFDPETKEPLIQVDRGLVRKLKPHQANGIKFMWNACFESVKRIKKDRGSGCILAHCMGLGKTLQVVSLTHTLLVHSSLTNVKRVLVVCPLSTVLNWVNEFTMWLKHAETEYEVDVFELSRYKQNSERAWQLQQWVDCGGVCVLGYEMFRNLSADNNKKFKKKMLKTFQEALVDPGPDLVVCDEGHLLKNEKTSLSQSMNRVRTLRRIVLTGTPLQNNLKEYYCMVQFVKPNLLGKYNEYLNRFVNPITNGQYTDSTERDISIMKRRSHVLHTMLDGAVQRRDYGVLAPFLPPKHEYVLFITLTEIQTKLYQHYLDNYSRRPLPGKSSGFLFPDFQSLQRIWTHPLVLKYNSERYEIMQQKKRDKEEEDSEGSLADFIDDESTPEESSTEESSDDLSDMSDDSRKKSKKKKSAKKGKGKDSKAAARRATRANPIEMEEDKPTSDIEEVKYENPTEWWMKLVTDEELEDIRHSNKLLLLFDILRQCDAIGDKLLVFSQSLYSLDLIEHFLGKVDEATQEARIDEKLAGHVGSWSPGVDYFRLDGSTSCENRSIWCKNFNREDNPRARLFLISTRAGGLGINLVAANRVVIFDVSWNPSHDVQSIFRVYRFGQKKPCYIYRFLAMGTMEEKIYERQVTKQAISKRVIDEQQIDRHYAANDLAELYKFEPVPSEPRPTPPLPKDRLFAELLKDRDNAIFRFHEHDSLLENKEEETLSEEERKRAWEEFENEKRAPPPAPFPNTWAMTNGMASLLQQQQQQLAYAALAAMIRKDMPNISDNQIRDMLPIICNANPGMFGGYDYGLMQKMNEIYKYAAPGMMNPSMMNPVMNPGGGMSTSSSLQYEPPWQRQQQQQQQIRLQQLMQQQQSMGAKYYAGGLGSRDPVAMAMQQQRAREFLLAGGGGPAGAAAVAAAGLARPRGRPPLQPRAPAASADVVNLADSD